MPTFQGLRAEIGVPATKGVTPVRSFNPPGQSFADQFFTISGITKDSAGTPLGGCSLVLLRTDDNSVAALGSSDASGVYSLGASSEVNHRVDAYKAGAPDLAGTTVNTLKGL